jgi:hypothetical protein
MGDVIASSHRRSELALGSPANAHPGVAIALDDVRDWRRESVLGEYLPIIEELLTEAVRDADLVVALGDAHGRLLWVDGSVRTRRAVGEMGFVPGADWAETSVGTSAPGTALVVGRAVQVAGAEHFAPSVHPYSCSAVPIRNLGTGEVLGVLDITGGADAVAPTSLAMLRATARAVETEVQLRSIRHGNAERHDRGPAPTRPITVPSQRPRLRLLGRDEALLELPDRAPVVLSRRHSELLALLASSRDGLSSGELAGLAHEEGMRAVTLRAELVRLRGVLAEAGAELTLASRPYRLSAPLSTDAGAVLDAVSRGAHRQALRGYLGPVLPNSTAPGIRDLRDRTRATLREALLELGSAESLLAWLEVPGNADDADVRYELLRLLPPRSPKRAALVADLEGLE